jgi:hypothetical protein
LQDNKLTATTLANSCNTPVRLVGSAFLNCAAGLANSPVCPVPAPPVVGPITNVNVPYDGQMTLSPGTNYGAVKVNDRGVLRLSAGTYRFQSLTVGYDAVLQSLSGPVTIIVDGKIVFNDRVNFKDFTDLNQKNSNLPLSAFIVAPSGSVFLSYRVKLDGSIAAEWLTARDDSVLRCNRPAL